MTTLQGLFSCSISTSFQTDKLTVHMNDNTTCTRAIFNTIATYQTDCIHEYTRCQHYQGMFSHSIHRLYKGSIEQRNTECPLYVSWNMTGFLHHIRGHVLTLHHVIHTSLPMLYCRLTARAWDRRGVFPFTSTPRHLTCMLCARMWHDFSPTSMDRYNRHTSPDSHHCQPTMTPFVPSTRAWQRSARLHMYTYIRAVIAKLAFWILQTYTLMNHMSQKVLCATV